MLIVVQDLNIFGDWSDEVPVLPDLAWMAWEITK